MRLPTVGASGTNLGAPCGILVDGHFHPQLTPFFASFSPPQALPIPESFRTLEKIVPDPTGLKMKMIFKDLSLLFF